MAAPITDSRNEEFDIDDMARLTASLSDEQGKLVVGGIILSGDLAGYSAVAQLDLHQEHVDFAKHFSVASTVLTVSYWPNRKA